MITYTRPNPNKIKDWPKLLKLGFSALKLKQDLAVLSEQINLPLKAEQYYLSAIQIDKDYLPPYMNLAYFYLKNYNFLIWSSNQ